MVRSHEGCNRDAGPDSALRRHHPTLRPMAAITREGNKSPPPPAKAEASAGDYPGERPARGRRPPIILFSHITPHHPPQQTRIPFMRAGSETRSSPQTRPKPSPGRPRSAKPGGDPDQGDPAPAGSGFMNVHQPGDFQHHIRISAPNRRYTETSTPSLDEFVM